ncbi:unnamed protein product, partial [marine sediment metagenome]
QIYEVTQGEAIIVTGVGQHQIWAAQHYWYNKPHRLISSGGLGAMGFELPAAMGANVAGPSIGKDAFQEVDITGITLPITKHNYLVLEVGSLAKVVKETFHLARTGRPGPLLIDIAKDVLMSQAEFSYPSKVDLPGYKPTLEGHPTQIKKAAKLMTEAQRPLIIAGRGVIISEGYAELKQLAETAQIPVVTTLLGIGGFPESHILSYGWLGMHG